MRKSLLIAFAAVAMGVAGQAGARSHSYHSHAFHEYGPRWGGSHYTNVNGDSVHSPMHARHRPAAATAHCADGTWSFSRHARGTCSRHGGIG